MELLLFGLKVFAVLSGGLGGFCWAYWWLNKRKTDILHQKSELYASPSLKEQSRKTLDERLLAFARNTSRSIALRAHTPLISSVLKKKASAWLGTHASKAGIQGDISPEGLVESSLRIASVMAVFGGAVGIIFSIEMAFLGVGVGCVWGAGTIVRVILRTERKRSESLGRNLSEMLETVSLGLRSGLSFDRSFQLYGEHFDIPFARECKTAQRRWQIGFVTREKALRDLAASYDSPTFSRVVENIIRSLHFGSSLAQSLEATALETRAVHRAHIEEKVATASVKMMIPTGVLILPAMLLLVLGPVLLELMGGF